MWHLSMSTLSPVSLTVQSINRTMMRQPALDLPRGITVCSANTSPPNLEPTLQCCKLVRKRCCYTSPDQCQCGSSWAFAPTGGAYTRAVKHLDDSALRKERRSSEKEACREEEESSQARLQPARKSLAVQHQMIPSCEEETRTQRLRDSPCRPGERWRLDPDLQGSDSPKNT